MTKKLIEWKKKNKKQKKKTKSVLPRCGVGATCAARGPVVRQTITR
jgi:hypothetical protein